jgi:hypothetical protein
MKDRTVLFSQYRVGNWMQRDGKEFQLTVADLIEILQSEDNKNLPLPVKLNTQWLIYFNFSNDRKRNKKSDVDGLWIKDGVTLYESAWDGDFNYGTYVRGDGEFKGGFSVDYVHHLQNLYSVFNIMKPELKIERYY